MEWFIVVVGTNSTPFVSDLHIIKDNMFDLPLYLKWYKNLQQMERDV